LDRASLYAGVSASHEEQIMTPAKKPVRVGPRAGETLVTTFEAEGALGIVFKDDAGDTWPRVRGVMRVRVEIMGSHRCGIVGKSQSVLVDDHSHIICTRSRIGFSLSVLGQACRTLCGAADRRPCGDGQVRRVVAGLASKQAPQLTAGCKLLSVNGTSVASLSFEDASLQVFAKAGRPITMVWELPTVGNTQGGRGVFHSLCACLSLCCEAVSTGNSHSM
jgi:hypothetical protein